MLLLEGGFKVAAPFLGKHSLKPCNVKCSFIKANTVVERSGPQGIHKSEETIGAGIHKAYLGTVVPKAISVHIEAIIVFFL